MEEKLQEEKDLEEQRARVESLKGELATKIKRKNIEEESATLKEAERGLRKQLKKTKIRKAQAIYRRRRLKRLVGGFGHGIYAAEKKAFKGGKTIVIESRMRRARRRHG